MTFCYSSYTTNQDGYFLSANIGGLFWRDFYALTNLNVYYATLRYTSDTADGTDTAWRLMRNTIVGSNAPGISFILLSLSTHLLVGTDPMDAATKIVNSGQPGTPVFAVVAVGDGGNINQAMVKYLFLAIINKFLTLAL